MAYSLTRDPVFYIMAGFFALLTTVLPAAIGQPRFLPVSQCLALTFFVAIPIRRRQPRFAVYVMALWIVLELACIITVTLIMPASVERAMGDGFAYRGALLAWLYAGEVLPHAFMFEPWSRLLEIGGVILGSLLTAGLVGSWFLVRAVNLVGFTIATVAASLDTPMGWVLSLPFWSLARIAGLAGLLILCAEPLLTHNWSLDFYWTQRRHLLLISLALLLLGIAFEVLLAPGWSRLAS